MTTAEQAELKLLIWWLRVGAIASIIVAFSFGLWVRGLQSEAAQNTQRQVMDSVRLDAHASRLALQDQTLTDLVLLQCAQPGLNPTEQRICRRYEPRMPR